MRLTNPCFRILEENCANYKERQELYDVLENIGKYPVSYDIWEENDKGIHMNFAICYNTIGNKFKKKKKTMQNNKKGGRCV